ncbi:hypothetical protein ES703_52592 [subsurface metagenome]
MAAVAGFSPWSCSLTLVKGLPVEALLAAFAVWAEADVCSAMGVWVLLENICSKFELEPLPEVELLRSFVWPVDTWTCAGFKFWRSSLAEGLSACSLPLPFVNSESPGASGWLR